MAKNNRPLLYLDEIVFSRAAMQGREWSNKGSILSVDQRLYYSGFRTVIVAVNAQQGLVYWDSKEQTTN